MIHLYKSHEVGSTSHSAESVLFRAGGLRMYFQWKSAQDGRTPYYWFYLAVGDRQLVSWTYNPNRI